MDIGKFVDNTGNLILKIVMGIGIFIFTILSVVSVVGTTYIDTELNGFHEYADFQLDNYFATVLLVILFFYIIYLIDYCIGIEKINTNKIKNIALIYVISIGVIWILMLRGYPMEDQSIVQKNAANFINGDYSALEKGQYLSNFPHQLGIVFILECIYRIFGTENYQAMMFLNVLLVAGIFYFLFKILTKVTDNKKAHNLFWMMVFGCFPLIFYSFFVYGTVIGLFFSVMGMYFLMRFHETNKYRNYFIAFVAFGIAVISKSNYQIFVIAAFLVLLFSSVKEKKFKYLIPTLALLLTFISPNLIKLYYSEASGIETGKGTPATLYIAMGLQDGDKDNSCGAAGWYNFYVVTTMNSAGYDYDKANEMAKENISQRLKEFAKNPVKAADFACEKIVTQWAEPTFETFWMTQAKGNHSEESPIMESIVNGKANVILLKIMKIYLMLMWIGNLIYLIFNWKKLDIWQMLLTIVVMGGFIFHLFWEGKSQYTMPYFVVSMVAGVQGILYCYEKLKIQCKKVMKK